MKVLEEAVRKSKPACILGRKFFSRFLDGNSQGTCFLYFHPCANSKWFTSWLGEESHKNCLGKTYQLQISFPNKPSNEVTRLNSGHPGAEVVRCDPFLLGHGISSGAMLADWWFQIFYMFIPIRGRFPFWLIFFQMGWNHQLVRCREGICLMWK